MASIQVAARNAKKKIESIYGGWFGYGLMLVAPFKKKKKWHFIYECPIHGPFYSCITRLKKRVGGCPHCAKEHTKRLNIQKANHARSFAVKSRKEKIYKGGKRKCSKCGKWKDLESGFNWCKTRQSWRSRCKECGRKRLKELRSNDNYRLNAHRNYDNSEKGKKRYEAKKKRDLTKRLLENRACVLHHNECLQCGCKSVDKHQRRFCSTTCSLKYKFNESVDKECANCGRLFIGVINSRYCPECAKVKNQESINRLRRKHKLMSSDKKRAQYYGVFYERVNRKKLFYRDKWKCKECGRKVVKPTGNNKPNEATLGHIVPISLGGSHSYSNCQCECRECNSKKTNKILGQQLTIFARVDVY